MAKGKKAEAGSGQLLRIKQIGSVIGCPDKQRQTVRGLGLRRMHQVVERPDTPAADRRTVPRPTAPHSDPVDVDPETLGTVPRLPSTQAEALDALADDAVLTDALGPVLAESYLAVRRSEWTAYSTGDAGFEQLGHFEKY